MTEPPTAKVTDIADHPRTRPSPKPPEEPPKQTTQPALAVCFLPLHDKDVSDRCMSSTFRLVRNEHGALVWVCAECRRVHDGGRCGWLTL